MYQFEASGETGLEGYGHWLTEILDAREFLDDSGSAFRKRVEACLMCGQGRTATERIGDVSAGSWAPFRLSASLTPSWVGRRR